MAPDAASPIYPLALTAEAPGARSGFLVRTWRVGRRRPAALAGAVVVLLFGAMALGAPWIATTDPVRTDWSQIRKAPTWAHPFGTDDLGRDGLSRVVWGARISMQAGVFSILLAIAIGVPVGLVAGFYRGALDQAIMRLTDAWLAFPFLILAIGLVTILGPSLTNATLAIGLGATPTYIRLTRGLVLSTSEENYVHGARALGAGDVRLMARHAASAAPRARQSWSAVHDYAGGRAPRRPPPRRPPARGRGPDGPRGPRPPPPTTSPAPGRPAVSASAPTPTEGPHSLPPSPA